MKIDLAEVNRAKASILSSKSTLQGQINDAKASLKSIVSSDALSGKVKGAIDAKVSNHQVPLLTSYYDTISSLSHEFDKLIQNFKSTVKESSDHALIDSDELTQLEAKFSPKLTEFSQIETQFKTAYSDISGIVAIEKASGSGFKEEMEKTKKVLTNTKTWMASFKGSSNSIAENIARQTAQLGKLSSTSGVSYTSPEALTIFQDKAFKKQVSKDHKKAKELEKAELLARNQSTKNKGLAHVVIVNGIDKTKVNQVGKEINSALGGIEIDLESLKSGVLSGAVGFEKELLTSKVSDEVAEKLASGLINSIKNNTTTFMNKGLVAVTTAGRNVTFSAPPTMLTNIIRNGARYAAPGVGAVIDFGMQKASGEKTGDAIVKTGGHIGAGILGAKAGTVIGGPIGTAVGFGVGVAGSMIFDVVYDNKEKIASGVKDVADKVGDAISGVWGNVSSAF